MFLRSAFYREGFRIFPIIHSDVDPSLQTELILEAVGPEKI